MASGDFIVFDQWRLDRGRKIHDDDNDVFKLALITSAITPAANTADPRFGAGGSTNLATFQVTPGGNYSNGGVVIPNPTLVLAGSVVTWGAGSVLISVSGANPNNARWGIVVNDTATGKQCCGYVDLGTVIDLSVSNFQANPNAAGLVQW